MPFPGHKLRNLRWWLAIGAWVAIASIPIGILLLTFVLAMRQPDMAFNLIFPILGVSAIAAAAIYVLCDNIGRRRWKSRVGHSCVRCGYNMVTNLGGICPECGLEWAAFRSYPGTWLGWRHTQRSLCRIRLEGITDQGVDGPTWRVNVAAFGRESEAKLVEALRAEIGTQRLISLVAVTDGGQVTDGEVVGHIMLSPITILPDGGGPREAPAVDALALAPMAVIPRLQRCGIGCSLVRAALKMAHEAGHQRVIVLGHPDYYPRFGFVRASSHGVRAPFEVPDDAWMALALTPSAFDGCPGTVQYPRAFLDV